MTKKILASFLFLFLIAGAVAQTPTAAAPTATSAPNILDQYAAARQAFDLAYRLSKPPLFQGLYVGLPGFPAGQITSDQTIALLKKIMAAGYVVDEQIEIWGWDPFNTMQDRQGYGYTWVAPATGFGTVGAVGAPASYGSGPVPPGMIKVSTTASDFPPYPVPTAGTAPAAPPTPAVANPVGPRIIPATPSQPNFVNDIFACVKQPDGWPYFATWSGSVGSFTGTWTKESLEAGLMPCAWVKTQ